MWVKKQQLEPYIELTGSKLVKENDKAVYRHPVIKLLCCIQFSCSVMSDSETPWNASHQASLSITNTQSLLKFMSIESVMPSNHLILCHPLLLLPLVFPSIRVWRRQWHPTPVPLPGKSHGWRSLVGCRPWGCKEWDTTERLHFHFPLPCIGEGNDNPLQCSCLENPRDGVAWWAAVYGVAQSRTQLKRLSSSSIRVFSNESVLHIR